MTALFIIGILLWIFLSLFLFIWVMTSSLRQNKYFDKRVYKKVMGLAKGEDFLLINSTNIRIDDEQHKADYFLIGDKFCYLIKEYNFTGALSGDLRDNLWNNDTIKGKRMMVANLLKFQRNEALIYDSFLQKKAVNECQYVIPIVVVPNNLSIDPSLKSEFENSYLFKLKNLVKGIKSIEKKSTVPPLSEESVVRIKETILPLAEQRS